MKRFLMLFGVAAVAGAMYVASAAGGQQSRGPSARQFAALKKQVAGLSNTVKALKSSVASDEATIQSQATTITSQATAITSLQTTVGNDDGFIKNCLIAGGVQGVSEYGDPAGTFGYGWTDDTGTYLTTALDWDFSNFPDLWLAAVSPSCISGAAARHGLTMHRVTTLPAVKQH
jgi:hypothetical protein